MSEVFYCNKQAVSFTNNGARELFQVWIALAEELGHQELADAFQQRLDNPDGSLAVGIDEDALSANLNSHPLRAAWLDVIRNLVEDLEVEGPASESMGIRWSDNLRMVWLEKLDKLRDTLVEQTATPMPEVTPA